MERVTGSLAFGALARVVLCAVKVKSEDERRILARAKSNIGPDGGGFEYSIVQAEPAPGIATSAIEWGKPIEGSARELLAEAETDDEDGGGDGPSDCAEWLRELLSAGALSVPEVKRSASDAGYAWRTVQRAMKRAGAAHRRTGFAKGGEWFLKSIGATSAPFAPLTERGADGANGGADADSETF